MNKAFVFPGQGSQVVGMGLEFYKNFDVAKKVLEEVNDAYGDNLTKIMFEGPIETLTGTQYAQTAIMAVSIAILRVIETELGLNINNLCGFLAGHSLGEYTAYCASKAISLTDTVKLLKIRGEAFAKVGKESKGGMASLLGATLEQAEEIAKKAELPNEICQISNDNTIGQVVLSGNENSINKAVEIATQMGIKKVVKLNVSGAFHSDLMEPACEVMEKVLDKTAIQQPIVPVISNVYVDKTSDIEMIKKGLLKQIISRVRWRETMLYFEKNGVDEIIEIGSGNVLSKMVKRTLPNMNSFSINSVDILKDYINKKK